MVWVPFKTGTLNKFLYHTCFFCVSSALTSLKASTSAKSPSKWATVTCVMSQTPVSTGKQGYFLKCYFQEKYTQYVHVNYINYNSSSCVKSSREGRFSSRLSFLFEFQRFELKPSRNSQLTNFGGNIYCKHYLPDSTSRSVAWR